MESPPTAAVGRTGEGLGNLGAGWRRGRGCGCGPGMGPPGRRRRAGAGGGGNAAGPGRDAAQDVGSRRATAGLPRFSGQARANHPAIGRTREVVMKQDGTCRVLVVEEHPVTREVLRRLLRACGCEAVAGDTAAGAEAELGTVGWVVLDLHLAGGAGGELLRALRRRGLPVQLAVA